MRTQQRKDNAKAKYAVFLSCLKAASTEGDEAELTGLEPE